MKIIISCLSPSSFFQQPNRKKIWQRKTNDWGTPTTENKGKHFSLISKPCLCRQTLTVVYSNKPIPLPLNQECWSPKQICGLQLTLKHCARISSAVKTPLSSFLLGLCLLCTVAVTPTPLKQDCISQGAFPARVCSAKMLEWTPTRHLGRAGGSTPGLSLGAPRSAEGLSHS